MIQSSRYSSVSVPFQNKVQLQNKAVAKVKRG